MELNIKVWKPIPKLKSQQRQFLMVNNQWLIDNAELLRNGGFEIDEEIYNEIVEETKTIIQENIKIELEKEAWIELKESDIFEESPEPLFEFDKQEEKELKPKKLKK